MLPAAKPTCSGIVISGIATTGFVASTGAFLGVFGAGLGFLGIVLVATAATGCSVLTSGIAISGVAATGLGVTISAFLVVFLAGLGFLGGALVATAETGCSVFAFGAGFSGGGFGCFHKGINNIKSIVKSKRSVFYSEIKSLPSFKRFYSGFGR